MSWICPKCETENYDNVTICEVCDTPHYPDNCRKLVDNKEMIWRKKAISYNNQITKLDHIISKYSSKYYEDVIKYAPYLLMSADSGEQEAQYMLGDLFLSHDNYAYKNNAFVWFARAANQGNGKAMTLLALCYEKGYGTEENAIEAQKWYERSINKDSEIADIAKQGLNRIKKKRIMSDG